MTKLELINQIAQKAGLTKKEAGNALAALTSTITDELKAGERIAISNLGTFEVRERAARVPVIIPGQARPWRSPRSVFLLSKQLRR